MRLGGLVLAVGGCGESSSRMSAKLSMVTHPAREAVVGLVLGKQLESPSSAVCRKPGSSLGRHIAEV